MADALLAGLAALVFAALAGGVVVFLAGLAFFLLVARRFVFLRETSPDLLLRIEATSWSAVLSVDVMINVPLLWLIVLFPQLHRRPSILYQAR